MNRYIYAKSNNDISKLEYDNRKIAFLAASEAIVLLKNDGSLPLKQRSVALFGAGARKTIKGGTGSGEVNERYYVSLYSGLLNYGFKITSNKWLDEYDEEFENALSVYNHIKMNPFTIFNDLFEQFSYPFGKQITKESYSGEANIAIYIVARQAGEGADKSLDNNDYHLSREEVANLKYLKENFKQVILIINSGSGMDLSEVDDLNLNAIIFAPGLGCEGGNALSAILAGDIAPSGHLSSTWPLSYKDIPFGDEYSYLNNNPGLELYKEGIYVGYRYFDTFKVNVRYPFGYGLSYTDFSYHSTNYRIDNDIVSFDCIVKNIGNFPGKDVIQIYASMPNGLLTKEYKRLVAFYKTSTLAPNEEEVIHVSFDVKDCASFLESEASFVLEKGKYYIWLARNVNDAKIIYAFNLDKDYYPVKCKNLVKCCQDLELLNPDFGNEYKDINDVECIDINNIEENIIKYDKYQMTATEDEKKILDSLSIKEKASLCVGMGALGMIDTKGVYVPGAVGKTTTSLFKKGLINVNLCDGPAGLRILKESALTKGGKLKMTEGNYVTSAMQRFPRWLLRMFLAKKKDDMLYQYVTSFPVGIALAQTFNKDLCYEIGHAVSLEMSEYGITYWLAPALNIHKNPLCGRNFEYFSEDPYLSGMMAKYINDGVTSINGNYATIKHFVCNNSETNRQHANSVLSERALREIYLKGFEICVKNSDVYALMSSYNLINGKYAGNRYDLNTDILRNEWGYKGLIMTDWYETGKDKADDVDAIKAGVDLIMPGTKKAKKAIIKKVKNSTLSMDDLDRACILNIRLILNSKVNKDLGNNND